MTEFLFMQDCDVESCEATIQSVNSTEDDRVDIVLDQTCFYPRGGTHVKNLSQIGKVHMPKLKEKKGVIRVTYSVEGINGE